MHKDTGEIREMEKVPKEKLGEWSYPFRVGQNVKVFGIDMKVVRVKKLRGEIVLRKH